MIPRNTWPHTHHDVVQRYFAKYDASIRKGEYHPLVYPFLSFGAAIVVGYLLVPHQNRPWLRHARFVVFAANLVNALYTIRYCRVKDFAGALGVGLMSVWSILWTGAILMCNDAQTDFWRIERVEGVFGSPEKRYRNEANKPCTSGSKEPQMNGSNEIYPNGSSKPHMNGKVANEGNGELKKRSNGSVLESTPHETLGPSQRHGEFAWQSYPLHPFIERLDWVIDLFFNFRGAGWNWRTNAMPPPPKSVQSELLRNSTNPPSSYSFKSHSSQAHVYPTRRSLLVNNAKTLIFGYLFLDLLKTIVIHDPYFWGLIDAQPPPYFPFSAILTKYPIVLRGFRLTVSQFAVMWALKTIYSLAPLVFSGLLGPSLLGARAEPWIYPETWGSFNNVLDKGLAGWWASWWHQSFRFAFEQPSRRIIEMTGLHPKGATAKLVQLFVAFGLSGLLHAVGSYTCHGETDPLGGPMAFFLLQAVAIFVESFSRPLLVKSRLPRWVKRLVTFAYVYLWLLYTGGLLCDDFARGGVLLFEPLPVSLFRGPLGLGVEGDSWWCFGGNGLRWYSSDKWWMSGITF